MLLICYLTKYRWVITILFAYNCIRPKCTLVVWKCIIILTIGTSGSSLSCTISYSNRRTSSGFLITSWTIIIYRDIHAWRYWRLQAKLWAQPSTPYAWTFISYRHISVAIIIGPLYKWKPLIYSQIIDVKILGISILCFYKT